MMDNILIRGDPADNIKPYKEKSMEKIDGVAAAIMIPGPGNTPRERRKRFGI